jgi:hypothetical protein
LINLLDIRKKSSTRNAVKSGKTTKGTRSRRKHFDEKDRKYKGLNKNLDKFFNLWDEYLLNEMLYVIAIFGAAKGGKHIGKVSNFARTKSLGPFFG